MHYITKLYNCDLILLKFLDIYDIVKLGSINKSLNKFVIRTSIYNEILQLKDIPKNNIIIECYQKGLLKILKKFYRNGINIIRHNGIDWASKMVM